MSENRLFGKQLA